MAGSIRTRDAPSATGGGSLKAIVRIASRGTSVSPGKTNTDCAGYGVAVDVSDWFGPGVAVRGKPGGTPRVAVVAAIGVGLGALTGAVAMSGGGPGSSSGVQVEASVTAAASSNALAALLFKVVRITHASACLPAFRHWCARPERSPRKLDRAGAVLAVGPAGW